MSAAAVLVFVGVFLTRHKLIGSDSKHPPLALRLCPPPRLLLGCVPTCDSSGPQAKAPAYPEPAETDSDLLPCQRPPAAWSLGLSLLQHVLAGADALPGHSCWATDACGHRGGVLSGPRAGGPSIAATPPEQWGDREPPRAWS